MKKKKGTKKRKGFTLIELLVVIAIIGLLATLAVVSMSSARAKARDAKRISDIRQMSTIIDVEDAASPGGALATCILADANAATCTGPGDVSAFGNFVDPSASDTVCATGVAANCQYGISTAGGLAAALTNNYQICFRTESNMTGVGNGVAGLKSIEPGGVFTNDCT